MFPAFSATQESAPLPKASSVVKPTAYVSLEPVPAGKEFQVAVVAQIAQGFHMNSHKPSDEYLIPTTLAAHPPAGIEALDTIYPEGHNEKFSFSPDKPLNVYTGTVTLRLRLSVKANTAPGAVEIPLTLRYQACNDTTCLPPVKLPVNVKVEIAPVGAASHALHPEIFSASAKKQ
jgi:Disulphide bond corrector protein DsbC